MTTSIQSKRTGIPIPLILAGFVVVGGGAYWLGKNRPATPPAAAEAPQTAAKPAANKGVVKFEEETLRLAKLEIGAAKPMSLASHLTATGQVEPNAAGQVTVTARVEGKVIRLSANVGDTVRQGQTVAIVESEKLHESQLAYSLALKRLSLARDVLNRRRKLASLGEYGKPQVEAARTVTTQAQGDAQKAQTEVSAAQADVREAEGQVRALQAGLSQAQARVTVQQTRMNRADALLKEQLVARQEWEQVQADLQQAKADVETARAKVAQGEAALESARARVQSAQAVLETARKRSDMAQQTLIRAESVYKGNYSTSKEVEEAASAYQQAQITAEAALDDIKLIGGTPGDLHTVPIPAPISGRVTERLTTLGETVQAGKPLLALLNAQTVWVQLNVYQKDLPALRMGQSIAFTSEATPGQTLRGVVSSIGESADEMTRTVKVRCVVQNAGGRLKPGVFVTGSIQGSAHAEALAVPKDAVQYVDNKPIVYVPTENAGEFRAHSIQIGAKHEDVIEVTGGLKPGDKLVTKNAFLVKSQAMKAELLEE